MNASFRRLIPWSVVLALGLTAIAQVEIWLLWMPDPDEARLVPLTVRAAAALGSLPLTLSLGLGRRFPVASLALAIPAVVLLPAGPLESSVAVVLAIVLAGVRAGLGAAGPREVALGVTAILGVLGATGIAHPGTVDELGDLAVLGLVLVGPWLAGWAVRLQQDHEAELEAAAARAEAARQGDAARSIAAERSRIARELHDIVAHAISVIVLQARGGQRAIEHDPETARQALRVIETTASSALSEMRHLVDVLRPVDAPGALEPPPGLALLEPLVAGVRDAGLAVDLRIEGEAVPLPPGLDLAAYRVVQEALTNTLRHAGAAGARVVVHYLPGAVEIEVADDGASVGRAMAVTKVGRGMIGMHERAALYGGTVEIGPGASGGFVVRARLPVVREPG